MRWLIDGYNVIRRDPELVAGEAAGLDAGRGDGRRARRATPRACCASSGPVDGFRQMG